MYIKQKQRKARNIVLPPSQSDVHFRYFNKLRDNLNLQIFHSILRNIWTQKILKFSLRFSKWTNNGRENQKKIFHCQGVLMGFEANKGFEIRTNCLTTRVRENTLIKNNNNIFELFFPFPYDFSATNRNISWKNLRLEHGFLFRKKLFCLSIAMHRQSHDHVGISSADRG